MPSCTRMRLVHTQVCPELRYLDAMAPCTAASRSASSKTMNGALPPSSIDSFFSVGAHCAVSTRPTSVEPVKLSFFITGLPVRTPPMARALPVTTFNTPGGTPARCANSASASADNGVCDAGLTTIVQRSEEHTSELQSLAYLVCRLL